MFNDRATLPRPLAAGAKAEVSGPRVALVGPLPPELGGTTAGGVATHQAYLAAGLAEAGIDVWLLATNAPASTWHGPSSAGLESCARRVSGARPLRTAKRRRTAPRTAFDVPATLGVASAASGSAHDAPAWPGLAGLDRVPRLGMSPLRWWDPEYVRTVGPTVLARYGLRLARARLEGSRRDLLGQLVWYRSFLSSVRPALVHVQHPLERQRLVRTVLQLEAARLPVVVTAHSLFGEHPPETIHRLMAPNLRAADRIIAVSPHVADQAVELGAPRDRVRVIRSGVDVERFRPRDRLQARQALGCCGLDSPLVLFVGNLEPRKQLDVLLRALSLVRQRLPNARLAIVGSGRFAGADDQTDRLHGLTRELELDVGPAPAVRFVGPVDGEDLLRWYAAADVFALPSSSEAQGIVALEAMACGLPVVASAVGGLLGTIDPGRTGYLVPPSDVAALAECLTALLADPARRATLGSSARQKVARDFSWRQAVQATIEVYREVLACP